MALNQNSWKGLSCFEAETHFPEGSGDREKGLVSSYLACELGMEPPCPDLLNFLVPDAGDTPW